MGQKGQDGYYAEECYFFFNFRAQIHQLKNRPDKKKKHVHNFVYKSHYLETKWGWVH